jgi:hypothetical protein
MSLQHVSACYYGSYTGLEEGDHTATSDSEMLEPGLSAEEAGYSIQETDYKRGQRFKKLQRILLSPLVSQSPR